MPTKAANEHLEDRKGKTAPFKCFGIELTNGSSEQAIGDCPFCDKVDHLYVSQVTGQWSCKSCGREGNVVTFLTEFALQCHKNTSEKEWAQLAKIRGIPAEAFKDAQVGWTGEEWIFPAFSETGTVRDLQRWNGERTIATAGCHLQLWNLDKLAAISGKKKRVWLCEGYHDGVALQWLLKQAGFFQDVVVAVPGASSFKAEWVKWFVGHMVIVCYDNDDAGDQGSKKAGRILKEVAGSLLYLCWPEARPLGWDLRDFVKEGIGTSIPAVEGIRLLEGLLHPQHRRDTSSPENAPPPSSDDQPINYDQLLTTFKKWVVIDDDFEEALTIALATVACQRIPGDPMWMYIVGPPSSGKTVILMSLKNHPEVFFQSSFTPASLISGYNTTPDPSIIPKMDGKTAVFKDGTELLAMRPEARAEAYGTLRGAYDGEASKPFGNSVGIRKYKCHFNMLIGVTPAIHGDNQSSMGERFLKYEMRENLALSEPKMRKAIENISKEVEMEQELGVATCSFLRRKMDLPQLPSPSDESLDKILAIAQLVAVLRAQVDRDFKDDELKYRPSHELGTRLAKQLMKLGKAIVFVLQKQDFDSEVMDLVAKVSLDSMVGFHADIVIVCCNTGEKGLTKDVISKEARIPHGVLAKRLTDMEHLGIISKRKPDDPRGIILPYRYFVVARIRELWKRSGFFYRKDIHGQD